MFLDYFNMLVSKVNFLKNIILIHVKNNNKKFYPNIILIKVPSLLKKKKLNNKHANFSFNFKYKSMLVYAKPINLGLLKLLIRF